MRNTSISNLVDYGKWAILAVARARNMPMVLRFPRKWALVFAAKGATTSENGEETKFEYKGKRVCLSGQGAASCAVAILLTNEAYPEIDATGMDVVDLGAHIGGTAIMFSLNGARRVFAVEPSIVAFNLMKKNIKQNKLTGQVRLFNAAAGTGKTALIDGSTANSDNRCGTGTDEVPVINIDDLVEENKIHDGILKVNIEGGEYEVLASAKEKTLRMFNTIVLEYHLGRVDELINKLEKCGFETHIYRKDSEQIGRIIAIKKKSGKP